MTKRIIPAILALLFAVPFLQARVSLPSFFSDNMVLQQQADVAVWGTTDKGAVKVRISPSWTRQKYSVKAGEDGKWFIRIPTPAAGGPYIITFDDGEKTLIRNVLLGEVWFCSGQSNMEMPMKGFRSQPVQGATDIILSAKASTPIRMCTIERNAAREPLDTAQGIWKENTPVAVANTSAVAYFFAMRVQQILDVPVGLLISVWGGTPIEAWMNRETIVKDFGDEFDLSFLDGEALPEKPQKRPCTLFNGQVAPLVPFTFRGILWYQGEENRARPQQYVRLQPAYVQMMRSLFQNPDAPFYFVQIAPWKSKHPENTTIPIFNEAQEKTLPLIPNSGMAATVDIGEYGTIHPCRKKEVGDRLALLALTKTYGIQGTVPGSSSYKESVGIDAESPSFKKSIFADGKAIVTMKVGKLGLSPIGQDLEGFDLAGEDGIFYPATGIVKDRYSVEVTSPDVPSPVAVRYCFHNWSRGSLYNCFGIPALPFRSDK
jgi:sialate O-acetylesterase